MQEFVHVESIKVGYENYFLSEKWRKKRDISHMFFNQMGTVFIR